MSTVERFIKYISIDTTSDSSKADTPSTEGQVAFAETLLDELLDLGITDIHFDRKHCYLYAYIEGEKELPKLGFISHLDTSESASGKNIKPVFHENYDGNDIKLNDEIVLSPTKFPDLKNHIGKTLITTDGTTLLAADDKAGISEIMQMVECIQKKDMKHGDIFICFTPDEEIGLGTLHLSKRLFHPDYAYTIDGSSVGELSYENFNAAHIAIEIDGVSTHLGAAKGVMVNAIRLATVINSLLPNELPENTEEREGFYHLKKLSGDVNHAQMDYLIRDFDKNEFEERKNTIIKIVDELNKKYNNCIKVTINNTYRNMKEVIVEKKESVEKVQKAMKNVGITPKINLIRGGTDGVEISFKGIPCPNIGTGGHNFHSVYEYITVEDMEKTTELLISIVKEFSKEKNKQYQK